MKKIITVFVSTSLYATTTNLAHTSHTQLDILIDATICVVYMRALFLLKGFIPLSLHNC